MADNNLIADPFGPLQGVRIVSTGTLVAQPFAAELAAEMGAEVIHIEKTGEGDLWRTVGGGAIASRDGGPAVAPTWVQERRNIFSTTLDLSKPQGRDLFIRLLGKCEIWMESSKPGTYDRWGLDDATVLAAHPSLVVAHVSGYGQSGDPAYLGRASYDMIAQAFGGMMFMNGPPDPEPPAFAKPIVADYITALFALWASLAGVIHSRATGRGQSIDIAQYEAVHKVLGSWMLNYFQTGTIVPRFGNRSGAVQPLDVYRASDGWVVIAALKVPFTRLCRVLGLDPNDAKWQSAHVNVGSAEGVEFDAILRGWVADRTVSQVVEILNEALVGCAAVYSPKDAAEDAHYQARQMHIEWEDVQVGKVRGIGIAPKFSATPGAIFRGSVPMGFDNQRVYGDLVGLSADELEELSRARII